MPHQSPLSRTPIYIACVILLVAAVPRSASIFTVDAPAHVRELFASVNYTIEYEIARFGHKSYGTSFHSQLKSTDPPTACSAIKKLHEVEEAMPFALIEPGGCSVRQKALHAQLAGASVAVIYGDAQKLANEAIVSQDESQTFEVVIPTIFIDRNIAELLLQKMLESPIRVSLEFLKEDLPKNRFDFALDILHEKQFVDLVKSLYSYRYIYGSEYEFTPYFQIFGTVSRSDTLNAEKNDQSRYPNCLGGGRYCLSSRVNVYNVLFQLCLYEYNADLWWKHNINMHEYREDGAHQSYQKVLDWAGEYAHRSLGQQHYKAVEKCMQESFEDQDRALFSFNRLLDAQLEFAERYAVSHYPVAVINDASVYLPVLSDAYITTDYQAQFTLYKLCQLWQGQKSKACLEYEMEFDQYNSWHESNRQRQHEDVWQKDLQRDKQNIWWVHVIIVLSCALIFVLFAAFYVRRMRLYQYNQQEKINDMVQEYYKLAAARTQKNQKPNDEL